MTRFRLAATALAITSALILAACGNGPTATSSAGGGGPVGKGGATLGAPAGVVVQATDQDVFAPASSTIKVNEIIEWENKGTQVHNVTFDEHDELTGDLSPGKTWEVSISKPGDYPYHCTIHPNMTATLHVTA